MLLYKYCVSSLLCSETIVAIGRVDERASEREGERETERESTSAGERASLRHGRQ